MKQSWSIKWRLFFTALITTGIALTIAGFGLVYLFERHITRRVDADLDISMRRALAHIEIAPQTGEITMAQPPGRGDPQRATMAFGGFYWQISENGKVLKTSRSLWDQTLPPPPRPVSGPGDIQRYTAPGPNDGELRVLFRQLLIDNPDGTPRLIGLFVAVDNSAVTEPRQEFIKDIVPSLALLAAFLIAATVIQLAYGLRPLEKIRREVNAIRAGEQSRFPEAGVPAEVQPLSNEINALLDAQDAAIYRARNRAGDLAHGLKTPLTALAGDIRRLRDRGENAIADEINQAVDMMNRHVAREMARARIRHSGTGRPARIKLAETLVPLVETLRRTPAGARLDWRMNIADSLNIDMDRDDLIECMGNLFENAARYARSAIAVDAAATTEGLKISVEDDGPGQTEEQCQMLVERGLRSDESGGAGLGLAIVQDVLDAYDARLSLTRGALGGLRADILFPPSESPAR